MSMSEWEKAEYKKILDKASIGTLKTVESQQISLINMEMLVLTAQVYYETGADVSTHVRVRYLPKSGIFDTIAYTSFYLSYWAEHDVKRSVPIDVPPLGFLKVELYNGDNIDTGRARVWYTAQRRKIA